MERTRLEELGVPLIELGCMSEHYGPTDRDCSIDPLGEFVVGGRYGSVGGPRTAA